MLPKLPLDRWIEALVDWLVDHLSGLFDALSLLINGLVEAFAAVFHAPHPLLFIAIVAAIGFWLGKWRMAALTAVGLYAIVNLGFWDETMDTLALVLSSAFISIVLGIPLGILCSRSKTAARIVTPALDFMQTMPAFVYLIPAVMFFGLGVVPGVIASVVFAVPPTIRLTHLGIRQVPGELSEAADAFGSTSTQKLLKVELPLAWPTVMAGVNQTIMLSLSMVVIASMIGAQGVGASVYRAVTQIKIGEGFEAGLAVVIVAIILDRFTQRMMKSERKRGM
ncbi:ABC transporter permease [Paenibacillus flagellatus]|uniref:Glycine/betaine ABC transporter n=1 Tax=Paenibacillus flagellatus TaxID=2211139 RepID=A0A2V5KDV4_9BACL|nr:proline/glycine betaine ABC transporter permease [Paenibacillus flagellatus]PYI56444.1 glycine/betaine ABC transporter [Paenibacillus flagellatus]